MSPVETVRIALARERNKIAGELLLGGRTTRIDTDARLARAAMGAMKQPTEAMIVALNGYACCAGYIPEGWDAAIDAALSEPSTPVGLGAGTERGGAE